MVTNRKNRSMFVWLTGGISRQPNVLMQCNLLKLRFTSCRLSLYCRQRDICLVYVTVANGFIALLSQIIVSKIISTLRR